MSCLSIYNLSDEKVEPFVMALNYTKLVPIDRNDNGFVVRDFEFSEVDISNDDRKNVHMQELCLCNLQALGVDGQLKFCSLNSDNFKIADYYESLQGVTQISTENNKEG